MTRPTTICEKCQRNISNNNILRHTTACKGPITTKHPWHKWKIDDNLYKHPDGYIGNMAQVKCHLINISGIDRSGRKSPMYGKIPWNKGLTKDTDNRIAQGAKAVSKTLKQKIANGWEPACVTWSKSEEGRKAKSEWRRELHRTNPETHPNRRLANNRSKMSYPEQLVYDELIKRNIVFKHNKKINRFYPDFIIDNLIIEIDGERWHNAEYDKKRDKILEAAGYTIKRFPVGNKKDLVERVFKYLSSH